MTIQTLSEEQTQKLGNQLSRLLGGGEVIALIGELGSGKTVFVHGLAEGLEVRDIVHSPSFMIANEYHGRLTLYHFDFYRLRVEEEIWNLGWQDYLNNVGIIVIEWADRFVKVLPTERLEILFTTDPENEQKRIITFIPIGEKYVNLLKNHFKFSG